MILGTLFPMPRSRTVTLKRVALLELGWSWMLYDRATISLAVGAARGYEFGRERASYDQAGGHMDPVTRDVGQWATKVEGYLRVGVAFGR